MQSEVLPDRPGKHILIAQTQDSGTRVVLAIDISTNYVWSTVATDDQTLQQVLDRSSAEPREQLINAQIPPRKFFVNFDGNRPALYVPAVHRFFASITVVTPEHRFYNYLWRHIWDQIMLIYDTLEIEGHWMIDDFEYKISEAVAVYNELDNDLLQFPPCWLLFSKFPSYYDSRIRRLLRDDHSCLQRDRELAFSRMSQVYYEKESEDTVN